MHTENMKYILELTDLCKYYPNFKLDHINMQIPYGKIVGLIGENGAGKTTLISLILNQIKRDYGSITILGQDNIEQNITIKQDIGFFVDECCFHPCLNAKNISNIMSSIYKSWDSEFFYSLLERLHVNTPKNISQLSKGMKNKLMLAVSIAHRPSLLILDEVTSGLDPIARDDILMLLKDYAHQNHATIFFSTHITSDLEKIADEIAFIHKGSMIFYNSLSALQQEYLLITCTEKEFHEIDKNLMIKVYHYDNSYMLLVKNDNYTENVGTSSIPRIDDLMLLYIKGENIV